MKTTSLTPTHKMAKVLIRSVPAGWGSRRPTPEERFEIIEDVARIDKDVSILKATVNVMGERLNSKT